MHYLSYSVSWFELVEEQIAVLIQLSLAESIYEVTLPILSYSALQKNLVILVISLIKWVFLAKDFEL